MKTLFGILLAYTDVKKEGSLGTQFKTIDDTFISELILIDEDNIKLSNISSPKNMYIVTLQLLDAIKTESLRGIPVIQNISDIPIEILNNNVIASTDRTLAIHTEALNNNVIVVTDNVLEIPENFIKNFIVKYNDNKVSKYVTVEMYSYIDFKYNKLITSPVLSNNEINISLLDF